MNENYKPINRETVTSCAGKQDYKSQKNSVLNQYKEVYQNLFDLVPCFITVQDKNYKLLRFNDEFQDTFDPRLGDYCYKAYKGRTEKCVVCPVENTFKDGQSHWSEEAGVAKDGSELFWVVKTAPIKNSTGEIIAAMEMCLDITHIKQLENKLVASEKKYRAIFNNIPNPLFLLDAETFKILDCNGNVLPVYGYSRYEIIDKSFLMFFKAEDRDRYATTLKNSAFINHAKNIGKDGRELFVNIRVSPSEYLGRNSLIVTTGDITQNVEMEQQLIQASKMATLGEMATGVAHELNQPLSVIKTASNYFMRKITKNEEIESGTLKNLLQKIGSNVDRATKIIDHMREFGRKSDKTLEKVHLNDVLNKAYEVMAQQLTLRGIEIVWKLQDNLPIIMADSIRLEQVFINLFLNARDAIEDEKELTNDKYAKATITLRTFFKDSTICIEVWDTGVGIPGNISEKIFEPFFTTKKVGKGTGLGLSISYGILKDYGGRIQVKSNRDKGSCFLITFPI